MSAAEIIAEIKALPTSELDHLLGFLVSDKELREDLQDSILLESRRHEPSRPLADVLNLRQAHTNSGMERGLAD